MYLEMCHDITIGEYKVKCLASVSIKKSIETLSDTATIVLPGMVHNKTTKLNAKINRGDKVSIKLGYNGNLVEEFAGYVAKVNNDNDDYEIECIDSLYLFKVPVPDKEYKNPSLKDLLNAVVAQCKVDCKVDCDFDFSYDKFTFRQCTGYDVLKKLQDETKANVYFENGVLHLHPPYEHITNNISVEYDFGQNVESSTLKYVLAEDKKVEIEVTAKDAKGHTKKVTIGTTGGEKHTFKCPSSNEAEMRKFAKAQESIFLHSGYEGQITGWLVPYVDPAYKVYINDPDNMSRGGEYYVTAVAVEFSSSGGKRTITLGRRLNG